MFNRKLKLFIEGRRDVFERLENTLKNKKVIWFHTASLGEFEQGLPVIEEVKKNHPQHTILVTFFSPSGYEVKKNSTAAHIITYLPLDTRTNAEKFVKTVNPELAVFVKYEFWPNYLYTLKKNKVKTLLISGIFRPEQVFFKPWGGFMRRSLNSFMHFFVQDENSQALLKSIGFTNVTVSGDTRFDRVLEILDRDNTLDFIADFKQDKLCVVAGSTWPEDEALLVRYINNDKTPTKYILAPHNIKQPHIANLKEGIQRKTLLFSEKEGNKTSNFDVFIIDTVGLLTKIYSYADIAYVGGGMGNTGLHNVLEPAVFGVPVVIGKNYQKFKEARELLSGGGLISVENSNSFTEIMLKLTADTALRTTMGNQNKTYIIQQKGAKEQIIYYINNIL